MIKSKLICIFSVLLVSFFIFSVYVPVNNEFNNTGNKKNRICDLTSC
ncbi:hypothetical protein [Silvanigrella aquatica]|nr:hypothetical protein [Silvanigrella aquatica]